MENQHQHLSPATQTSKHTKPASKKRKKKRFNTPLLVLGVILAVFLLVVLAGYLAFHSVYSSMNIQQRDNLVQVSAAWTPEESESEEIPEGAEVLTAEEAEALDRELMENVNNNELFEDKNVYNILLLGNDTRGTGMNERTDVMLLVSINTSTKQITMTSFLRDIYIYIPGYYSQRLNAANVFGGPGLTIDTIEQNFGISIDNYAQVNFIAFVDIIDTLGGVDVYLSAAEAQVVGCGYDAGDYHLNGDQALAYCRIRYLDSDFGRTQRQQKVLTSLWTAVKDDLSLSTATSIMQTVLPQVTTDLSQADCLNLALIATQIGNYSLSTQQVPTSGTYYLTMINGMSVLRVDFDANKSMLLSSIYAQ